MTWEGTDCGDNCVVTKGVYLSDGKLFIIIALIIFFVWLIAWKHQK